MENPKPAAKWYHGIIPVFSALLFLGPLAFPLLWKSTRFNLFWKIAFTVLVIAATIWMIRASAEIINTAIQQLDELKQTGLV